MIAREKRGYRGIVQLVEYRSPKPQVVGSNPTAPERMRLPFTFVDGSLTLYSEKARWFNALFSKYKTAQSAVRGLAEVFLRQDYLFEQLKMEKSRFFNFFPIYRVC